MGKEICPCKGCNSRYVGCHGECGKYILWRNNDLDSKRESYKKKSFETSYNRYKIEACKRSLKRAGRIK